MRADTRRRLLDGITSPETANGTIVVNGSVGIGKTTFLQSLATAARAEGIQVGWGVCGEFAAAPPMWGWSEAISSVDADFRVNTEGGEQDIATGMVFRSIANWIGERSADRPLLLILDDLHDADQSTVDLFAYLSRRPRTSTWTVIGSTRPGRDDITSLRCPQVNLDGLDTTETITLAESIGVALSADEADQLRRRTNGNPLFIRRLIEHRAHTTSLPPELSTLLRQELDEILPSVRPIVDALSVLGTSAERSLLAEVVADTDADFNAVESGGVLVTEGEAIAFSHALMRELMYDDLGDDRRGSLHAHVADVLRNRGESPLTVAHHLRRAATTQQGRPAAEMALEAGDLAIGMGALPEAVEHYGLAVSILDRVGSPDERADGLLRRARALSFAGRVESAAATLDDAAELGDELSIDLKRALLREYGRLRWREEPNLTALNGKWLLDRIDAWMPEPTEPDDIAVRAIAEVAAGEIDGFARRHLDAAEISVEAAHETGDIGLIGEALLGRRRALMVHPGTFDRRETDSQAALDAARDAADSEMTVRAQRMVVADALVAGDRPTALSIIGAIEDVPTAGLREHEALWRAGAATIEGRYDDAEEILTEASKELAYLGVEAPSLEFVRSIFALDDGTFSKALEQYEPLIAVIADPVLQSAFALAAATDGDMDRANALLDEAIPTLLENDETLLWPMAMAMCGEASAATNRPECAQLLAAIEPCAGYCMTPNAAAIPWLGAYDRLIGLLRMRTGDLEGAVDALGSSLRIHQRLRARPWAARSHAALAIALGALDRHDEATEHGRLAGEIAAELQMGPVLVIGDFDLVGVETPAAPTAEPDPAPADTDSAARSGTLRRSGNGWEIEFGGDAHHVGNLAGMRFLHVLLESPGNDWHVLDLYGAASGGATIVEGSSGAMLDDTARRLYQDRYRELSAELEEAESSADIGRVERLQNELDALEQELLSAFGLGGRSRQLDDPSERARVNVRRSISRALDAIAKSDPPMADHLRHRVTTGRFCRYSPDAGDPVTWRVI